MKVKLGLVTAAAVCIATMATGAAAEGLVTAPPPATTKVDLSTLPADGAIVWGKTSGVPLTIFTDFRCVYCQALVTQLEHMNVRVIERPISSMGTRDLSNRVYCAKDRMRAAKAAYAGEAVPPASCNTSGLDANEAFARRHRFSGTPVLVRKDGVVLIGYRPREFLEVWMKGAR